MSDFLIVGGGVVGLSIAYELAVQGAGVRVIDRGACGQQTSWAGAGILPAAVLRGEDSAYDQLSGLSEQLHPRWAEQLRAETGIDTAYRRCAEIFLTRSTEQRASSQHEIQDLQARGIQVDELDCDALRELEPAIDQATFAAADLIAYCTPKAAQLRNPWHLRALVNACTKRGVEIVQHADVIGFEVRGDRIKAAKTTTGDYSAEQFCVTTGAWTSLLAESLGLSIPIRPIRGQIALIRLERQILCNVVHEGLRYVVPRADGRVLVGTTLEDVGFDKRTTATAISEMLGFAGTLSPELAAADVEQCWAGFRPGSADGLPYLGGIPELTNGWIAAGHFRWGLYLSPATAVVMSELLRGQLPQIDLHDFRVGR